MVACPGGPILEIPKDGPYIFERLTPGTIREEDYYEDFRVVIGKGGRRILLACPRGNTDRKGKCTGGQRLLRIWHGRDGEKELLKRCKDGDLKKARASEIRKIEEDIRRINRGEKPSLGAWIFRDKYAPRKIVTFAIVGAAVLALVNAVMDSVAVPKEK
jgi:hypothetical protein